MRPVKLPQGSSLLLRLPNWVGDIVMATPSIEAIKRERPDLKLTLGVRKHLLPLVKDYPGINSVISIEGRTISSSLDFLRKVRRGDFPATIIYSKGFRDALISRFSGCPARIGFSVNSRGFLLTHPVKMTEEIWKKHHALQFGELLEPLGIKLKDERPFLPVDEEGLKGARNILEKYGLKEKRFAVFHVGASKFPRAYHSERFAEAAKRVSSETGMEVALIGTAEDRPYIESFMSVFSRCRDLSGRIDLKTLPAFLSLSFLFVGNDSGPMHLASAVGTPVVALFGPGSPEKTAPLLPADKMRIIYEPLPCSPCRQSFFKDCRPSANGKPPCLELISHEVLAGQILDLIKKLNFSL